MNIKKNKVILLRHAESEKNIKQIHGGGGEKITPCGYRQIENFCNWIVDKINIHKTRVYASTSIHTRETAQLIVSKLQLPLETPSFFKPLYLGVAEGLSEKELQLQYPDIQKNFDRWRKREIDIKQLNIDGMEPYLVFWKRGIEIMEILKRNTDNILVCSNSLMILLTNFMLGYDPCITDNYKHITIPYCGVITFETYNFQHFQINYEMTNVDLNK